MFGKNFYIMSSELGKQFVKDIINKREKLLDKIDAFYIKNKDLEDIQSLMYKNFQDELNEFEKITSGFLV